ncbi:hypothetical protein TIFTF001_023830 [Ficus carica]|uniref:Transmembrane protein n=1 Tax=Ficus carica TaxID=3494 RepID=A0AA88DGI0_FICCA|nr:hypothetical protein TIFTF001_023830 [Ficus carica]
MDGVPIPVAPPVQQQSSATATATMAAAPAAATTYPLVMLVSNDYRSRRITPLRIFWFILSHITFYLALFCASKKTKLYVSETTTATADVADQCYYFHTVVFYTAMIVHEVFLFGLLLSPHGVLEAAFRGYCGHFLWKSVGEVMLMIAASFLLVKETNMSQGRESGSGSGHHYGVSEVAMLLSTYVLLTVDALCIMNLLRPGHHYSIFEVVAALTVHLSLKLQHHYLPVLCWFVVFVVFLIIIVKNYLWRNAGLVAAVPPANIAGQRGVEMV